MQFNHLCKEKLTLDTIELYAEPIVLFADVLCIIATGQVGLGAGSWPSNRATEGSNPKGTRLYFVILLMNVEFFFD